MGRLLAAGMIVALGGVALLIYAGLDAPVNRVRVSGELDDEQRRQVRETIRQSLKGGLLSADLDALSDAIMTLRWPRSVAVRRMWPGTLEVAVEMPMVVARWGGEMLASDGRVVNLSGARRDLPTFECAGAEPPVAMEVFHRLSEASAGRGLRITLLREDELGEWSVTFGGGLTVALGSDSLGERLDRFLTVYDQRLAERLEAIAHVDARYDNGVAVSWRSDLPDGELLAAAVKIGEL